jgi:hypothetical protein
MHHPKNCISQHDFVEYLVSVFMISASTVRSFDLKQFQPGTAAQPSSKYGYNICCILDVIFDFAKRNVLDNDVPRSLFLSLYSILYVYIYIYIYMYIYLNLIHRFMLYLCLTHLPTLYQPRGEQQWVWFGLTQAAVDDAWFPDSASSGGEI